VLSITALCIEKEKKEEEEEKEKKQYRLILQQHAHLMQETTETVHLVCKNRATHKKITGTVGQSIY